MSEKYKDSEKKCHGFEITLKKQMFNEHCSCQSDVATAAAVERGATEVDNINGCL